MYMYKFQRKENTFVFLILMHIHLPLFLFMLEGRKMGHTMMIIDDKFSSNKICSGFQSFKVYKKNDCLFYPKLLIQGLRKMFCYCFPERTQFHYRLTSFFERIFDRKIWSQNACSSFSFQISVIQTFCLKMAVCFNELQIKYALINGREKI